LKHYSSDNFPHKKLVAHTEAELARREGRSYESALELLARIRLNKSTDQRKKTRK
jgi:hypothetical protein